MPGDATLEIRKSRRETVQLRHGAVGSVAAGIIRGGPLATFFIEVANLVTFLEEFAIELLAAGFVQRLVIDSFFTRRNGIS